MAELKSIEREKQSLGIVTKSNLGAVQAEILKTVRKSTHPLEKPKRSGRHKHQRLVRSNEEAEREEMQLVSQVQRLTVAMKKMKMLQKEQNSSSKEVAVIRSLYFREVFRRFEKIHDADPSSNEWAFDPRKTTFPSWLESQNDNDGLYYIFGKVCYPKKFIH